MKIVVPTLENGQVNGHFGHSDFFTVFSTDENKEIISRDVVNASEECGCKSSLVETFAGMGVRICLAGNMGPGAVTKFQNNGITVVRGCSGSAEENVKSYLLGKIDDSGELCNHHGHDHHHDGGHACNHNS
jgi:predicted Fe-Mo cluster-binding NifX family protein